MSKADRLLSLLAGVITALREGFSELVVGGSMALVAFSSGFISYTHISALTLEENQSWKTAHLYPACIDGQIVIGSFYFMNGKNRWQKAAGLLFGVLPGIGESLIANWASGWHGHNIGAALWATVPAQAFACSTFLFERWLHNLRHRPAGISRQLLPLLTPVSVLPRTLRPAPQRKAPRRVVTSAEPPKVLAPAADPDDPHQPLPAEPAPLEELVASLGRNDLVRDYAVTKHGADQLRKRFGIGQQSREEVDADAA